MSKENPQHRMELLRGHRLIEKPGGFDMGSHWQIDIYGDEQRNIRRGTKPYVRLIGDTPEELGKALAAWMESGFLSIEELTARAEQGKNLSAAGIPIPPLMRRPVKDDPRG